MFCVCIKGKFKAKFMFAYWYVLTVQHTLHVIFQFSLIRTSKDIYLAHAVLIISLLIKKSYEEIEFELLTNLWCIVNVLWASKPPIPMIS